MEINLEIIQNIAFEMGASQVGISELTGKVPEEFSTLCHGISIVYRLSDSIIDTIQEEPTMLYFHHYRAVNFCINQITLKIMTRLQQAGFHAVAVPASQTVDQGKKAGLFSHKHAACEAGLGYIGKNCLFISEKLGPRVRLGTILTDCPLPPTGSVMPSQCGSCNLCMKSCPVHAIEGVLWEPGMERSQLLDAFQCGQHMSTAYKRIGRGSVCGICMRVCPKNIPH